MQKTKDLMEVKDGSLSARVLEQDNQNEIEQARTFRHKIFLEELGWELLDSTGQEFDEYDKNAIHFGAFDDSHNLVGYCRVILRSGFMIEKEFADLVHPSYRIRKSKDTVETSRFAISKELRGKEEGFRAIAVLLRCVYQWAKINKVRYIYAVCASDHLGFLRGFFSCCKPIGPDYEYQPGISSSAFILDLEELDLTKVKELWSVLMSKSPSE